MLAIRKTIVPFQQKEANNNQNKHFNQTSKHMFS